MAARLEWVEEGAKGKKVETAGGDTFQDRKTGGGVRCGGLLCDVLLFRLFGGTTIQLPDKSHKEAYS